MALRWFVGLELDGKVWDHSTFSQNRRRRFNESGILEKLFDETVALSIRKGFVSKHARSGRE
jgi:transposase